MDREVIAKVKRVDQCHELKALGQGDLEYSRKDDPSLCHGLKEAEGCLEARTSSTMMIKR